MDISEKIRLYSFRYPKATDYYSEFIVTADGYVPLITPVREKISITGLLPFEGIDIPFSLEQGTIFFDAAYEGFLVRIKQSIGGINGSFLRTFMNRRLLNDKLRKNMILDGGHITLGDSSDITISPGMLVTDSGLVSFSGLTVQISDRINELNPGYGIGLSVFMISNDNVEYSGSIIPHFIITDLIAYQANDYSSMYSTIKYLYGVDYRDLSFVELVRGQFFVQPDYTTHIKTNISSRYRNPSIEST